jgi:hypothetical protein
MKQICRYVYDLPPHKTLHGSLVISNKWRSGHTVCMAPMLLYILQKKLHSIFFKDVRITIQNFRSMKVALLSHPPHRFAHLRIDTNEIKGIKVP